MQDSYIYIMTNKKHGSLYIGVTSDLIKRINEHREKVDNNSFTAKYNCNKLVYYEVFNGIEYAIAREKQLKAWKRKWKIELFEKKNPDWNDLFYEIIE